MSESRAYPMYGFQELSLGAFESQQEISTRILRNPLKLTGTIP